MSETSIARAQTDLPGKHFRTDHLLNDLHGTSMRGGVMTLAAQAAKFLLQMSSTMVLARLLSPKDFGLIAMVAAITGFVGIFKDCGLSLATVQRAEITHAQISTLFWINCLIGGTLMLVVMALAPVIVWFYHEPQLFWITLILSFTFVFNGLAVQHQALLRRQMQFKALAVIDIISLAAGVTVGVGMAWSGFGYWSLAGATIGTSLGAPITLFYLKSVWKNRRIYA